MKAFLGLIITIFFAGFIVYSAYTYSQSHEKAGNIYAPIPELLLNKFYKTTEHETVWIPTSARVLGAKSQPEIQAISAFSYDLTTNKVLFEKNADSRLPMASLTKVMTAIVAVENMDARDQITISRRVAEIGENTMGLTTGEKVTIEDLMYGLFLHSGNDAAEALAEGSPFGRDNFVYEMNKKAETLGLTNTRFTNPTGLEGDGNQYSTAKDLLVMTRYALDFDLIRKAASTYNHFITYTNSHKAFNLYNETNLLTTYPGVKGFKTGYTEEAGLCLITYLEYKGHRIIAVILNSPSRREEMIQILDYSLESLGIKPPNRG